MLWVALNMGMSAARCQGNVREMSGNFRVSGKWSPCQYYAEECAWEACMQCCAAECQGRGCVQMCVCFCLLLITVHCYTVVCTWPLDIYQMTPSPPPEINLGVKHGILTPRFLENIFWYTPTQNLHRNYIILKLGLGLWFLLSFIWFGDQWFVDSSKCGRHDFDPRSKNSSRVPESGCISATSVDVLLVYIAW